MYVSHAFNRWSFLLSFFLLVTIPAFSQSKPEAEKKFLQVLNQVLAENKNRQVSSSDSVSIESPFTIDKKGNLSLTVRHRGPKSNYRVRTEVPVADIRFVVVDLYVVLECSPGSVKMYKSDANDKFVLTEQLNLLHVVYVGDYTNWLERIDQPLKALKKYYPKK